MESFPRLQTPAAVSGNSIPCAQTLLRVHQTMITMLLPRARMPFFSPFASKVGTCYGSRRLGFRAWTQGIPQFPLTLSPIIHLQGRSSQHKCVTRWKESRCLSHHLEEATQGTRIICSGRSKRKEINVPHASSLRFGSCLLQQLVIVTH